MARAVLIVATAVAARGVAIALQLAAKDPHVVGFSSGSETPARWNPFDDRLEMFPVRAESPTTPRMLAMRGCSGSTAVDDYARQLFRIHGLNVAPAADPIWRANGDPIEPKGEGWPSELLRPDVNWLYREAGGDISKAMELQVARASKRNQTLFFKGLVHELANTDHWNTYVPFFKKHGLYTMMAHRWNQLDEIVCKVRDCFGDGYGHPVDATTGKESTLCFDRRKLAQKKSNRSNKVIALLDSNDGEADNYKAFIDVNRLISNIENENKLHDDARAKLHAAGFKLSDTTTEELLAFQSAKKDGVETSLRAWGSLLKSFGVKPDNDRIRYFLQQYSGSYPDSPSHNEVIYNMKEVRDTLRNSKTDFAKFIRP